eukprot:CAMPEP_0113947902 /NCGR_PEP_ID=MMETSP1339-20121228/67372_1 /TAXON_ID=94617 /ORGANISM="Fibrocapsa japonica" /LENGTH=92 /DNA_ID=CAMNT_0000954715 /DNA_START=1 /DNA_END=275 /DNA_ORIENTATION=- /assembly_acc=CAM_ASM_000762
MEMMFQADQMREAAPYNKLHEDDIADMMTEVCDPDQKKGRWLTQLDFIESKNLEQIWKGILRPFDPETSSNGNYLLLKDLESVGHCEEECST